MYIVCFYLASEYIYIYLFKSFSRYLMFPSCIVFLHCYGLYMYVYNSIPCVILDNRGITSLDCLQQVNGYDCGIHVLCNVDVIVQHVKQTNGIMSVCPKADVQSVRNKRCQLLVIINNLIKNQRS